MKFSLRLLLMTCLCLTGIPISSQSEVSPQSLSAKEKADLTVLARRSLLQQKAGDLLHATQKLDADAKAYLKKLEAENSMLLSQKAGDYWRSNPQKSAENVPKPRNDKFGIGILVGAVGVLVVEAVLIVAALASSGYSGGSC